ncbi:MAG: hypothetical protein K9J12_09290 [Melioribacteraceae bacterium]|nr:hypothetical protein [Melioribacteraceae bacterium]MCF8264994.1 hypothetical protein [Melioribacteraceae bacterium]MCF8414262.1 hypothetical protein [Melioribacteraceae bacterium]MCF8431475.1 hypothetical protein [Melioribacteraceae bacterium]
MSEIIINKISTNSEISKFLKFAWEIYKGDPHWVPPLLFDKKKILNKKKNPFFKHAEMDLFIAKRDGKIVGRIAAIKNDLHNSEHNENIGFFGFFECINDQAVADKLLDTAKNWIKERGLTYMRGPANPSSNDEYALLIDGFDDSPRLLMTYNPRYYKDLLENYGLEKAKDLFAFDIQNPRLKTQSKLFRVAEIAQKRQNVKIRSLNMKKFNNELEHVKKIYNLAWQPNWGFVPMTDEEINTMAADLKPLVEPNLVLFAEINDETIGFALVMLDYNRIFKEMNGRLFPFGFLKLFTQKKKIDWVRIIILGIIPEFQKKGIDAILYKECMERAENLGILQGEASWILEDNEMMIRGAEMMKGEAYKTYRVFEMKV